MRSFCCHNFFREEPLCVLCEYAMKVLLQESGIMSNRTIDMAEHAVEMLCSYMPVNILYKYQNAKFQNLNNVFGISLINFETWRSLNIGYLILANIC